MSFSLSGQQQLSIGSTLATAALTPVSPWTTVTSIFGSLLSGGLFGFGDQKRQLIAVGIGDKDGKGFKAFDATTKGVSKSDALAFGDQVGSAITTIAKEVGFSILPEKGFWVEASVGSKDPTTMLRGQRISSKPADIEAIVTRFFKDKEYSGFFKDTDGDTTKTDIFLNELKSGKTLTGALELSLGSKTAQTQTQQSLKEQGATSEADKLATSNGIFERVQAMGSDNVTQKALIGIGLIGLIYYFMR